jgi:regulator of protease activity HflC (stomatin/prohibitin superfamily)
MDPGALAVALPTVIGGLLLALRSLRQVNQWEVGLKFTMGRFTGKAQPGLNVVVPVFQRMIRVDTRIRNRDLPSQMVITRDNVTATIDAVVYFKVVDAEKAALNVENFELAVKDRAKVVLRDVVGEITLDELLTSRDEVAARIRAAVEQFVSRWGLHVELIALQDISLPPMMQEAIARKAIAERDKQAVIIKSQADLESAQNFSDAARIMAETPGAMELRRLEALQSISGSGNTKVIFDLAKPFDSGRGEAARMAAGMVEGAAPVPRARVEDPRADRARALQEEAAAADALGRAQFEGAARK